MWRGVRRSLRRTLNSRQIYLRRCVARRLIRRADWRGTASSSGVGEVPEPSSEQLYAKFERRVKGLRGARSAGERARTNASLRARELGLLYEATFLNLAITFEAFQESLFYSALLGRAGIQGVRPTIPFRHRAEAELERLRAELARLKKASANGKQRK